MKLYQDEAWLRHQYIELGHNIKIMGEECGVAWSTIAIWLKHFDIPRRPSAYEGQHEITKEFLETYYIDRGWSIKKCASVVGCGEHAIHDRLIKFEIPRRKSKVPSVILSKEWLELHYVTKQLTTEECALIANCGRSTIHRRLQEFGISTRLSASEIAASGVYCGPDHPSWKGGLSKLPYCFKFNEEFKEHIREKFNRKCYICPKTEAENKRKLAVHHIDYNKNSICNGKEWAFVPICTKHHSETNGNRWYWFNLLINYWAANPEIRLDNGVML